MANKPGEANFFPDVPVYPEMGTFQPVYGKFDLTTYIQGASDYEIMSFLVGKYNACLEAYGNITKLSTDTITACKQLQDWINSWFDNLDVQEELNKKIDSMVQDGSFGTLLHQTFDAQINQQTTNAVTSWLVANVTPTGSAVIVDKSSSISGAAADAKILGLTMTHASNWVSTYIKATINIVGNNLIPSLSPSKFNFLNRAGLMSIYFNDEGTNISFENFTSGYYALTVEYSDVWKFRLFDINRQEYNSDTANTTLAFFYVDKERNTVKRLWIATPSSTQHASSWVEKKINATINIDGDNLNPVLSPSVFSFIDRNGILSIYFNENDTNIPFHNFITGYYALTVEYSDGWKFRVFDINSQDYISDTTNTTLAFFEVNKEHNYVKRMWMVSPSIESGEVTKWSEKNWYAYGTSITNVSGEGRYPTYLARLSGLILTNKAISGGGIVNNKKVKNAIMNTTDGKLNADLITLEVGANDESATLGDIYDTSDDTLCGALNQCIRYLQQYVPKAQIIVWGSPTEIETFPNSEIYTPPETRSGSDNHTQYEQREAIKKVCAINSVKYIDMFESCGMGYYRQYYNRNLTQDGVHPSDIGGKNIAEYIWGQLKNVPLWYNNV